MAMGIKVVEESLVSPPPGSVPTTRLPLTFLDISYLGYSAIRRLIFLEFPHPTWYFIQTTLPNLKASLSRTLQHFFPLAAKVFVPSQSPQLPYFLYSEGDSVQFIACESTADFNHLTFHFDARRVQELQALAPDLPWSVNMSSSSSSSSTGGRRCMVKSVLAIQVTLFPMVGISIGVAICHSVADARSLDHFLKSWASLNRCGLNNNDSLPNLDRDLIKDPLGLASICMEEKRKFMEMSPPSPIVDDDDTKFQATFLINRCQVKSLKDWLAKKLIEEENQSEPLRISTFVATCAYIWVCLVKSRPHSSFVANDDEHCYFHFVVDCRERLKLPTTYFGNCLDLRLTSAKKSELLGMNGVAVAAKAIAREIKELDQGLLKGAENWSSRLAAILKAGSQIVLIFESPKFGAYKIDFGWGRPSKIETTVDVGGLESLSSVFIYENREDEGGVEFGVGFATKHHFNRFNAIFNRGLYLLGKLVNRTQNRNRL